MKKNRRHNWVRDYSVSNLPEFLDVFNVTVQDYSVNWPEIRAQYEEI